MSALEKINNAYIELLSIATLGERKGSEIAQTLMDNKHLWTKVYLPDETQEHWMELVDGEEITVDNVNTGRKIPKTPIEKSPVLQAILIMPALQSGVLRP